MKQNKITLKELEKDGCLIAETHCQLYRYQNTEYVVVRDQVMTREEDNESDKVIFPY